MTNKPEAHKLKSIPHDLPDKVKALNRRKRRQWCSLIKHHADRMAAYLAVAAAPCP